MAGGPYAVTPDAQWLRSRDLVGQSIQCSIGLAGERGVGSLAERVDCHPYSSINLHEQRASAKTGSRKYEPQGDGADY